MMTFHVLHTRRLLILAAIGLTAMGSAAAAEPTGKVTIAWHVTLSPAWLDPSTAPPQITPFGMLYAIHDAHGRKRSFAACS